MEGVTLYSGIPSEMTEMLVTLVLLEIGNIIDNGNWFGSMEPIDICTLRAPFQ